MRRLSRKSPPADRTRRPKFGQVGALVSPYPKPPRELAGKWVAVLVSGGNVTLETLYGVLSRQLASE